MTEAEALAALAALPPDEEAVAALKARRKAAGCVFPEGAAHADASDEDSFCRAFVAQRRAHLEWFVAYRRMQAEVAEAERLHVKPVRDRWQAVLAPLEAILGNRCP